MSEDTKHKVIGKALQAIPKVSLIGLCAALIASSVGCPAGPVNAPGASSGATVSFANDIQPIFNALCTSCHSPGFPTNTIVGIQMVLTPGDAFDSLVNQKSVQDPSLTLVIPGDSANSLLFQKVASDTPPVGATMPLVGGRRLNSTELALVRDWIDQGAMNN